MFKEFKNGIKLKCKQIQLDYTKFLFTNIKEMNERPPSVVQYLTINKLYHHLLNQDIR